jgi:hypothetical protein
MGGFEPSEHQAELLAGRHRPPIAGPQVGAEDHDISRCKTVQQVWRRREARKPEERRARPCGRMAVERRVDRGKAAVDFRLGGDRIHAIEQRMPETVVRHGVALRQLAPCQLRMGRSVSADQKEGGEDAFPPERIEHCGCRAGPWAIVERQHDLLVGEGQGRGKVLAADARCRGGIDPNDPGGREGVRVAGTGLLYGLSCQGLGGKQEGWQGELYDGHWFDMAGARAVADIGLFAARQRRCNIYVRKVQSDPPPRRGRSWHFFGRCRRAARGA